MNSSNWGMVGIIIGVGSAASVPLIMWLVSNSGRKHRDFIRAQGSVETAFIKQIVGRGINVGITFEIKLATGSIGKAYGGLGDRGFDMAWLQDAFATNKPVEIVYHPDARTVLIKDPRSGQFL